jgi:hypothetical protein
MNINQRTLSGLATVVAFYCTVNPTDVNATSTGWQTTSPPRFTVTLPLSEMDARAWPTELDQADLITAKQLWQSDAHGNASDVAYFSRQAINHMPHSREAYQMLSAAVRSLEQPSAEYIVLVKRGHSLFPLDDDIALGLAVALANTSEPQQAIELINKLLSNPLAVAETVTQAQLIHSWILQSEYCPKIRELVRKRRFAEALALANDFRSRSIDEASLLAADAMRSFVEVTERVQLLEVSLQD